MWERGILLLPLLVLLLLLLNGAEEEPTSFHFANPFAFSYSIACPRAVSTVKRIAIPPWLRLRWVSHAWRSPATAVPAIITRG